MPTARFALVLHCHLPYVHHVEREGLIEEDWLYEAIAESYLPLLTMLERLEDDGVPVRVTLSVSPTLCEMLAAPLVRERCSRYLAEHAALARRELARREGGPFGAAARAHVDLYEGAITAWEERCERDIPGWVRELVERRLVEPMASAATHAVLPLLDSPIARRAQIETGIDCVARHLGRRPAGFWLPECAYEQGLEAQLADAGVGYFLLDAHGLLLAEPRPPHGVFAPVATPVGPWALGRDVESSRQVWSGAEGYPGDAAYREFHRDQGFEADPTHLGACLRGGGRHHVGLKLHRVTGDVPMDSKEPYEPLAALQRAREHAAHFVAQRARQAREVHAAAGIDPVLVCPYDAELFGHWWLEGVAFLEAVFRAVAREPAVAPVCISDALGRHRDPVGARPATSSWGNGGYFEMWVNASNDWIYPRLQSAQVAMQQMAARDVRGRLERRALDQAARSLLLAQSSDWPFLIATGGAPDYARHRFEGFLGRCERLLGQVQQGVVGEPTVRECERLDSVFPWLSYGAFAPAAPAEGRPD